MCSACSVLLLARRRKGAVRCPRKRLLIKASVRFFSVRWDYAIGLGVPLASTRNETDPCEDGIVIALYSMIGDSNILGIQCKRGAAFAAGAEKETKKGWVAGTYKKKSHGRNDARPGCSAVRVPTPTALYKPFTLCIRGTHIRAHCNGVAWRSRDCIACRVWILHRKGRRCLLFLPFLRTCIPLFGVLALLFSFTRAVDVERHQDEQEVEERFGY